MNLTRRQTFILLESVKGCVVGKPGKSEGHLSVFWSFKQATCTFGAPFLRARTWKLMGHLLSFPKGDHYASCHLYCYGYAIPTRRNGVQKVHICPLKIPEDALLPLLLAWLNRNTAFYTHKQYEIWCNTVELFII